MTPHVSPQAMGTALSAPSPGAAGSPVGHSGQARGAPQMGARLSQQAPAPGRTPRACLSLTVLQGFHGTPAQTLRPLQPTLPAPRSADPPLSCPTVTPRKRPSYPTWPGRPPSLPTLTQPASLHLPRHLRAPRGRARSVPDRLCAPTLPLRALTPRAGPCCDL